MRAIFAACLALLLAAPASAGEQRPTLAELESELICPTCETTLDQSRSPVAERMRVYIRARIAAGDTKSEIKDSLVAQFGPAVLAAPPASGFNLLAWVLPIAGVVAGAAVLGVLAWRWSRSRAGGGESPAAAALEPEIEQRLDEELARFDA